MTVKQGFAMLVAVAVAFVLFGVALQSWAPAEGHAANREPVGSLGAEHRYEVGRTPGTDAWLCRVDATGPVCR